jgi:hypothetical protein
MALFAIAFLPQFIRNLNLTAGTVYLGLGARSHSSDDDGSDSARPQRRPAPRTPSGPKASGQQPAPVRRYQHNVVHAPPT